MRCPLKVLAYDLRPQGIQGKEYELRPPKDPDGAPHRQLVCTDYLKKTFNQEDKHCVWWNCGRQACGITV